MAQTTTPAAQTALATSGAGKTTIDDGVVAKIAGIAAREVPGVHALGGGAARVFGAVRDAIGNTDLAQGVRVDVGETQVAADVTIVVAYPQPLQTVADAVRASVARAITELIGLEPAEINVVIADVHIPGEETAEEQEPRVR